MKRTNKLQISKLENKVHEENSSYFWHPKQFEKHCCLIVLLEMQLTTNNRMVKRRGCTSWRIHPHRRLQSTQQIDPVSLQGHGLALPRFTFEI